MSLRDQILSADDRKLVKVGVPEWDTCVFIRTLAGTEREAWEIASYNDGKIDRTFFRARLLVRTICDETGKREFEDSDAAALSEKNGAVLSRLYDIAAKQNGLTKEDEDELVKN